MSRPRILLGIYEVILVKPFRALARGLLEVVDRFMIDTVVVNGSGFVMQLFSRVSRWIQNGQVQRYLVGIVLGAAAIFLFTNRAEHPSFSYRAVDGGIEFKAEPGHGLHKDATIRWDFDGDGNMDEAPTGPVVVVKPGEVRTHVSVFIGDPVWGKKDKKGEDTRWIKVTRRVDAPAPTTATPGGVP